MENLFMKREPLSYKKKPFWCRFLGMHRWFKGNFIAPVHGRYERHCTLCGRKEFPVYKDKRTKWVHFDDNHPRGFDK